jgi:mRNA-degrading endonuclease RelE of RelBE toxin-antitoxin system
MYEIRYAESVADDLKKLRTAQRTRILDRIEVQLTHQPLQQTRNRKVLVGLVPPWDHEEPVWLLRIGEFRAFYDVNEGPESLPFGLFVISHRIRPRRKSYEGY